MTVINMAAPKAGAKRELLFNKPASAGLRAPLSLILKKLSQEHSSLFIRNVIDEEEKRFKTLTPGGWPPIWPSPALPSLPTLSSSSPSSTTGTSQTQGEVVEPLGVLLGRLGACTL